MKRRKNPLVTGLEIALFTTAGIAGINVVFATLTSRKNKKAQKKDSYYTWKLGKIHYTKRGCGSPVLLVHSLDPSDSSLNSSNLADYLSANHTVYSIDLIGYGLSEKPWVTYTNYVYVCLINDFIKEVIGEKTSVIAFESSGLVALQAHSMSPDRYDKLLLVKPRRSERINPPAFLAKFLAKGVAAPIYGTFAYNLICLIRLSFSDAAGKYALASRLEGTMPTDISKHEYLITDSVVVIGDERDKNPVDFQVIAKAL